MPPKQTDAIIVGAGPCGSLVAYELARAGFSVTVLEAGPDAGPLPNRESNGAKILWNEPRVYSGPDSIAPKAGTGLGGGTLPWLGVMPRFHSRDFRTQSTEGVGIDWPLEYAGLRPHYAKVEQAFGVAGDCGPFAAEQYTLPMPAHPMNWHAQLLARGATQLGAHPFAPPIAINSTPYNNRPACVYCGWCGSGCTSQAKATAANTYLEWARQSGAHIIPQAFVSFIHYNPSTGRATGVDYIDSSGATHQLDASIVVLAAHAIETPRLLLLSANSTFRNGLANSSGCVGRYFMSHPAWQIFGVFHDVVNAYKGMQMGHVMVQDYYAPNPSNHYARGYILLSYMMTPITYANLSGLIFGHELKRFLSDYPHTASWWVHGEGLPSAANAVTLDPTVKDHRGLPVARLTYAWTDNDRALVHAGKEQAAAMLTASGAYEIRIGAQYAAHAMGGCRMGRDPQHSVTNSTGQTHDIRNLFICDTSLFPTSAGVNPTLTAMALADRSAQAIIDLARKGEL